MSIKTQKEAFVAYEADNWYLRNKDTRYVKEGDVVMTVLREYSVSPVSVLEVGCSTGYRLHAISSTFPGVQVSGIEPSPAAIIIGKEKYPEVNFVNGTEDDMSAFEEASFDLVIVGFVLYVVDRQLLFRAIAETDRVLKDGGVLMIVDFFSERAVRNAYQHIRDIEAFAYKQNYDEIFTASKLYHLLDKRSMSHTEKHYSLSNDYYDKYSVTTLKKDYSAGYK
jgi:ubiquinone/menaquinone biosynthesis C-methylase UbiE